MVTIIIGILLIALILNAIFTRGITFEHEGGFRLTSEDLFKNILTDGYADVTLGDYPPQFGIPLVFQVYLVESPPYAIKIFINDDSGLLKSFFLESVTIEYINGDEIEHDVDWEKDFGTRFPEPLPRYIIGKLPVTVDRRQNCKIRFVGYFVNKEGVKIPFDSTGHLWYEVPEWRIYPVAGSF